MALDFKNRIIKLQISNQRAANEHISDIISYLLILLFVYASIVKLASTETFISELMQSPLLPQSLIFIIAVAVPSFELIIALLLFFEKTRSLGFLLSFFIMLLFTLYMVLIFSNFSNLDNIPCSCGGILGSMSYPVHIMFNTVFCIISAVGMYIESNINMTSK
jgi:hypothetical protein